MLISPMQQERVPYSSRQWVFALHEDSSKATARSITFQSELFVEIGQLYKRIGNFSIILNKVPIILDEA